MRVLAAGSTPPPEGARQGSFLAEVLALRQEGAEVEVLALDPLASAHRYLAGPGLTCALEVALAARRCDRVIVQLEPGLPVRGRAGRIERAICLLALSAALGAGPPATIRLTGLDDLPGGFGGRAARRLWKVATRIEVGDESVAAALSGEMSELADRLVVQGAGPAGPAPGAAVEGWAEKGPVSACEAMAVVRRRAAAERLALAGRGMLPGPGSDGRTRVPQWEWLPCPGAGVPDLGALGPRPPRSSPSRRAALAVLAAAERREVTRAVARLALSLRREARALLSGS